MCCHKCVASMTSLETGLHGLCGEISPYSWAMCILLHTLPWVTISAGQEKQFGVMMQSSHQEIGGVAMEVTHLTTITCLNCICLCEVEQR